MFINVDAAKEEKQESLFWDPSAIEEIVKLAKTLLVGGDVDPEDIAVFSPYAPQIEWAKERLGTDGIDLGACVSIDGAQGNEYSIVTISFVRCNEKCKLGFLDGFRRLNVGITRAMRAWFDINRQSAYVANPRY